jgi:hypothetical protein
MSRCLYGVIEPQGESRRVWFLAWLKHNTNLAKMQGQKEVVVAAACAGAAAGALAVWWWGRAEQAGAGECCQRTPPTTLLAAGSSTVATRGTVYLVGAGPGGVGLMTVRAYEVPCPIPDSRCKRSPWLSALRDFHILFQASTRQPPPSDPLSSPILFHIRYHACPHLAHCASTNLNGCCSKLT